MSQDILQQLNYESALKALDFYNQVKAKWADFEKQVAAAEQRVADAQGTLQKLNSGTAVTEIAFLFDVEDAVVEQVPELRLVLGFADAVQAKIDQIRSEIDQGQQLVANEVQYLNHLIDVGNAIVKAHDGGAIVKQFIEGTFQSWLAQQAPIPVADLGTIQFLALPDSPPFSTGANIEVRVIYDGGFSLTIKGVYFEYQPSDPVHPLIRLKNPTVTSDVDVPAGAAELLGQALDKIPLPVGLQTSGIEVKPGSPNHLPVVRVPVSFAFPATSFGGLAFTAVAVIEPGKPVRVEGSATVTLGDIPIFSTGFFFVQPSVTYRTVDNALVLGTLIAPAASAGS